MIFFLNLNGVFSCDEKLTDLFFFIEMKRRDLMSPSMTKMNLLNRVFLNEVFFLRKIDLFFLIEMEKRD